MADDVRPRQGNAARAGGGAGRRARGTGTTRDSATSGARERLRFEDPRTIRALAHPARMAIVDALSAGDALTATDCAAVTGLTPSATAYHLKFLERYGFVEHAPDRPDGRERPWRVPERQVTVELDSSTPAGAAAVATVAAAQFDSTRTVGLEFIEASHAESQQWRDAPILANADVWLTVDEVEAVEMQLAAVLDPYRARREEADRPDGARRVRVMNVVFPHPPKKG